ncbi:MAG TPA: hypothetical protein VFF74_08605 [Methylophilaceae bacterium]|nr:hypothetical protein [Methylophilaceae bacterium]
MKFTRIIALALILVLASSQALAAACSTSCLTSIIGAQAVSTEMADMDADPCHHQQPAPNQHQDQHKTCTMAGCHFSQTAPAGLLATYGTPYFSNTTLPHFVPLALSADLSPPIKPPA